MPTGYTAAVRDGSITELDQFALRCARAFGPLISMRDDSLSTRIPFNLEPELYYKKRLDESVELLRKLQNMTEAECDSEAESDYQYLLNSRSNRINEQVEFRSRYEIMLEKVNSWNPPESILPLKNFMIQQLTGSISHDCHEDNDKYDLPPIRLTGQEWLEKEIQDTKENIAYYSDKWDKEIEKTNEANIWLDTLRISLL